MNKQIKKRLSKRISYALRHGPEKFNLHLDGGGWVEMEDVFNALRITREDLDEIMADSDKVRFELNGTLIRATYGHSIKKKIQLEANEPPETLYHGTYPKVADKIQKDGLKPMGRQYVHLSEETDTAEMVGGRRARRPVIFEVDAKKAFEDGINFYHGNDTTWLAEPIPGRYLKRL